MQKTATLNLRVDPDVKQSAESVLAQLGMSMSTAIDMFLRQVSLTGGIPFRVALPEAPRSVDAGSMTDEQLRDALLRGLREVERDEGTETSVAFSRMREEPPPVREYEVRVSPSAMIAQTARPPVRSASPLVDVPRDWFLPPLMGRSHDASKSETGFEFWEPSPAIILFC